MSDLDVQQTQLLVPKQGEELTESLPIIKSEYL
jgi:hypothetical protein